MFFPGLLLPNSDLGPMSWLPYASGMPRSDSLPESGAQAATKVSFQLEEPLLPLGTVMALNWAQRRYFLNLTGASAGFAVALVHV